MSRRLSLCLKAVLVCVVVLNGHSVAAARDSSDDAAAPAGETPDKGPADDGRTLPAPALEALTAFRKVAWKDRLKPARGAKLDSGWSTGVRAEWLLGSLERRHRPALEALLTEKDRFVRALAARSLGLQGDPKATPALARALKAERDQLIICSLIQALGRTGGDGALAAVEKLQKPGVAKDVQHHIGLARRQLKGGKWDVDSMRGEHEEAARANVVAVAKKGAIAPELGLPSPDGPINLSVLRDKIVVLAFVHGDRGPKDNKVLSRLALRQEYFKRHDVQIVVVVPHEKERTQIWRQRARHAFKVASDPAGRAAAKYGLAKQLLSGSEWLPSPGWFVIDRKGKLVWSRVGTKMGDHASLGDLMPVIKDVAAGVKLD